MWASVVAAKTSRGAPAARSTAGRCTERGRRLRSWDPRDIGHGSLLPTTSIDQFHATLAKWFGLSDSDVLDVLPNLGAFSPTYLDFL